MTISSRAFVAGSLVALAGACGNPDTATVATGDVPPVAAPRADTLRPAVADSPRRPPSSSQTAATPAPPRRARPTVRETRPDSSGPRQFLVGIEDVTALGYDRGDPAAPVVVVEFSDFGCPYCADFALETFPALDSLYIRTGKVFFKYVPFIAGTFRNAAEATRAAECVADQRPEQFWLMMTHLYETQKGWKSRGSPDGLLRIVARSARVDSAQFAGCYADQRTDVRTKTATDAANRVGVWVTPSFVINGRPVQGALPLAEFRKVIDAELARARQR